MTDQRNAHDEIVDEDVTSAEDEAVVRGELARMREFVGGLSMDDLKQGDWFVKLLAFAMAGYTDKVDAAYFREKYPHLPSDAIVQKRIRTAANYAAIEGGISALAYNGAVAGTIGSGGAASPLTLPGAGAAFVVDTTYLAFLQLRMAWDIAVLYGVPLDLSDPEDTWKFVKIAMGVKLGEAGSSLAAKGVPAVLRPALKKVFSGSTLAAVKSLPVVGKMLLQRNIIKIGIPLVGVPVTVGVNRWTTKAVGEQAATAFRVEARIVEAAGRMVASATDHELLAWVVWLTIHADGKVTERQGLLLHHVTRAAVSAGTDPQVFGDLSAVIQADESSILERLAASHGDRRPYVAAAISAASVDGRVRSEEAAAVDRIAAACAVEVDEQQLKTQAKTWR